MASRVKAPQKPPARSNGKHPGGRPSEMTDEAVSKMLQGISLGMALVDVSYLAGTCRTTIWNWINEAQKAVEAGIATSEQREFLNKVEKAQREGQLHRLHRIQTGDPGWQGSAWIQERRFAKQWAAKQQIEHTGRDGGPIEVANLTPEQRAARVQELVAAGKSRKPDAGN